MFQSCFSNTHTHSHSPKHLYTDPTQFRRWQTADTVSNRFFFCFNDSVAISPARNQWPPSCAQRMVWAIIIRAASIRKYENLHLEIEIFQSVLSKIGEKSNSEMHVLCDGLLTKEWDKKRHKQRKIAWHWLSRVCVFVCLFLIGKSISIGILQPFISDMCVCVCVTHNSLAVSPSRPFRHVYCQFQQSASRNCISHKFYTVLQHFFLCRVEAADRVAILYE